MKKRICASVILVITMLALAFGMVGCGKKEISGVTLSLSGDSISYNPDTGTSSVSFSLTATNQNGDSSVKRFDYIVYCYDVYGGFVASQNFTYDYTISPHVTTYIDDMTFTVYGDEVSRIKIVPVSMLLGEKEVSSSDGPVITDVSTWGPGAWFWVVVAVVFALGVIGNIVAAVVSFNDWDYEEAWGNVGGAVVNAVIAIVILVILF